MTSHQEKSIKIAVVGDVHDQWEAEDELALKHLGIDLALFVGDFGNESVDVVEAIASLDLPKAAIMGNHDAWYSASDWGRKRCPYDREKEDRVQEQLDLLGEAHVGYGKLDFPKLNLSVVGSRPFSWGGLVWKNAEFYQERYKVTNFAESTERIVAAANSAAYETIIFMGHNGPIGLGDRAEDPCGKDWYPIGGDYGDPDFADAIAQSRNQGKTIALVTFGHMHHQLRHTKELRNPIYIGAEGTVYLNAASVPRIIQTPSDRLRNFSLVSLQNGVVSQASLVWLGCDFNIASEQILYRRQESVQSILSQ
ncbi:MULTISPECIES: TIGR04168 family protein [Cyanophyceae]|uniref:TIGR04168 family protein n=1 Tax=Cyanophyceae TaxID=3028117 RepID=UPI0016875683|nr:TIGR04168 family protein [Trichocoleus sp. FACHB-40]MBD2003032.1 TIGR04168 family protein [Trichocoleus sp. FACHB-40]